MKQCYSPVPWAKRYNETAVGKKSVPGSANVRSENFDLVQPNLTVYQTAANVAATIRNVASNDQPLSHSHEKFSDSLLCILEKYVSCS